MGSSKRRYIVLFADRIAWLAGPAGGQLGVLNFNASSSLVRMRDGQLEVHGEMQDEDGVQKLILTAANVRELVEWRAALDQVLRALRTQQQTSFSPPVRLFPSYFTGLTAAQRTAANSLISNGGDYIASVEELRAQPVEQLQQRIRLALSPGGEIVHLRDNYMVAVTACHFGQGYDSYWLRFAGGAMHFFSHDGSVLPLILEPAPTAMPIGQPVGQPMPMAEPMGGQIMGQPEPMGGQIMGQPIGQMVGQEQLMGQAQMAGQPVEQPMGPPPMTGHPHYLQPQMQMTGQPQMLMQAPMQTPPGQMKMMVTVPQGVQGGMPLQMQTPAGIMQVTVPNGLYPGQTFEILVPVGGANAGSTNQVAVVRQPQVVVHHHMDSGYGYGGRSTGGEVALGVVGGLMAGALIADAFDGGDDGFDGGW